MSLESSGDQPVETTPENQLPFPQARWGRELYGSFVIIMPIVAFWATSSFKPEWQNGEITSYAILLLFPEASLIFFPLLAISIFCYILLLISPDRFSSYFAVRLGIYTGVLLAFQYSVVSGIFFFPNASSSSHLIVGLIWISPIIASTVYPKAEAKWGTENILVVLITLSIAIFLVIPLVTQIPWASLLILLMGLTIASPFWSFLIFTRASIWLFKNHETKLTLPRGFGLTVWFAVYIAAWRYDILKMYELYASLPTQPPDCYIATAAAHGHPQFVGSQTLQRADGTTMQVNKQLQLLKCAELAIMAATSRLHRLLRHLYDAIGKPLAQKIKNPYLADIAYLLLKPIEWLAELGLKAIVPQIDSISRRIYTK